MPRSSLRSVAMADRNRARPAISFWGSCPYGILDCAGGIWRSSSWRGFVTRGFSHPFMSSFFGVHEKEARSPLRASAQRCFHSTRGALAFSVRPAAEGKCPCFGWPVRAQPPPFARLASASACAVRLGCICSRPLGRAVRPSASRLHSGMMGGSRRCSDASRSWPLSHRISVCCYPGGSVHAPLGWRAHVRALEGRWSALHTNAPVPLARC